MKKKKLLTVGALIFLIGACKKELPVKDFFKNVAGDKDYKKEVKMGDFELTSTYRPSELICLAEVSNGKENFRYNESSFKNELRKYENACYMDLSIHLQNGENVMVEGVGNQEQ